jgi:hypothetical protein
MTNEEYEQAVCDEGQRSRLTFDIEVRAMIKEAVEMEREACASIEVHLTTPDRDYTTMSPLDAYEAALIDAAIAFREAIRARGQG